METGYIQCTTNRDTVRIPIEKIHNNIAIYTSSYDVNAPHDLNWAEQNFAIVENSETKQNEIIISRPIDSIVWCALDFVNEKIDDTVIDVKNFFYIYDERTGLIHYISDKFITPETIHYKKHYNIVESETYYDPFVYGYIDNFIFVNDAIQFKFFTENQKFNNIGIITPWNISCGIAEYTRQLTEYFNFEYTILAPIVEKEDLIKQDGDNVVRCYGKFDIQKLLITIKELKLNNLWIHYSNSYFSKENIDDLVSFLIKNKIKFHFFNHSTNNPCKINTYDGVANVKIAPAEFNSKNKVIKNTIGTFGFLHHHKNFEHIFNFLSLNKKIHYHIYTNLNNIHTEEEAHNKYLNYLFESVKLLDIKNQVHFHFGFLDEKELLSKLSSCELLVLPYRHLNTESQSAAIKLCIATERPVLASDIPAFKNSGVNTVNLEYFDKFLNSFFKSGNIKEELNKHAKAIKKEYSKEDEYYQHLNYIQPYNDINILWRGDFTGIHSFSIVNRRLIKELTNWGVNVALRPDSLDFILDEDEWYLNDAFKKQHNESFISTGLHFPPLTGYCDYPIAAWETDKAPESWRLMANNKFKKLIVISEWVKKACLKSGFKEKEIAVVPLGTDQILSSYKDIGKEKVSLYIEENKALLDEYNNGSFVFLNVAVPEYRKGTDVLISAYLEEFSRYEDVVLVMKFNKNESWVKKLIQEQSDYFSPKIILIEEKVENIYDLYKFADVFVHPLRGEGFGLPILEAASCGIPSIVTGYAGPMDFTDKNNSWHIKYKKVTANYHHHVDGAKWAEPNKKHLKFLMRECYENRAAVKNKGINAYLNSKQFTWSKSAYKLLEILNETD